MTVFEKNILRNGKIIINNLPEKVKTDLLERIAIYYSNKYLASLDVNNTMYNGIARNNAYVLYGFISCLESADIIDNNKTYILKNFIDILAKQNDIVNNSSDIAIQEFINFKPCSKVTRLHKGFIENILNIRIDVF